MSKDNLLIRPTNAELGWAMGVVRYDSILRREILYLQAELKLEQCESAKWKHLSNIVLASEIAYLKEMAERLQSESANWESKCYYAIRDKEKAEAKIKKCYCDEPGDEECPQHGAWLKEQDLRMEIVNEKNELINLLMAHDRAWHEVAQTIGTYGGYGGVDGSQKDELGTAQSVITLCKKKDKAIEMLMEELKPTLDKCDHDVNLCWCSARDALSYAATALTKTPMRDPSKDSGEK